MRDNRSKKTILFVSHDCSLTGAPILLINLLDLLKKADYCNIEILLYRGGILENEFQKIAPTCILKSKSYSSSRFVKRAINYLRFRFRLINSLLKFRKVDLIFSNTLTNGKLLKQLVDLRAPVISYAHELGSVLAHYDKDQSVSLSVRYSSIIAVPSPVVRENLKATFQLSDSFFASLNYYFPKKQHEEMHKDSIKESFIKKYHLPPGKLYIVGMGVASLRKGIDLFVEVANTVVKSDSNFHFVWIGAYENEAMELSIAAKIRDYNLESKLTITGALPHSVDNLAPFDLFLLTSREDPYPLVVVEAAFLKNTSCLFF